MWFVWVHEMMHGTRRLHLSRHFLLCLFAKGENVLARALVCVHVCMFMGLGYVRARARVCSFVHVCGEFVAIAALLP